MAYGKSNGQVTDDITRQGQGRDPSTQWLKWKSWGGGTVPAHLGPLSVHVGPLLTVLVPQVITEPQSIYSFTKTVRLFFF